MDMLLYYDNIYTCFYLIKWLMRILEMRVRDITRLLRHHRRRRLNVSSCSLHWYSKLIKGVYGGICSSSYIMLFEQRISHSPIESQTSKSRAHPHIFEQKKNTTLITVYSIHNMRINSVLCLFYICKASMGGEKSLNFNTVL